MLTAYNIKIGNADGRKSDNKTKTENTEKSNDVIGPVSGSDTDSAAGSASDSTENNDMDAEWGEETNDKTETNDRAVTEKEDSDEQKDEQTTDRERSGSGIESSDAVYNYNGRKKLTWPVMGNIILPYSMDATVYFPTLEQYRYNPAIVISAAVNDKVNAVAKGKITDISENEVTGCTVKQDLGDGYTAIYGQLKELNFKNLAIVTTRNKRKTIGYVGEPTKYYSTEGSNVYFELQKDGKPVNPKEYLPEMPMNTLD